MPQLHFYVQKQVAERIRHEASVKGLSVSQYLANVVKQAFQPEWPSGYFENVIGGWRGELLQRADQGDFDARDPLLLGEK
jgi:hypothetical protein